MKKNYQKPTMNVVKIQHQSHILAGSVNGTSGNAGFIYGGASSNGGNGTGAHSRHNNVWDWDDEDDE